MSVTGCALWVSAFYLLVGQFEIDSLNFWSMVGLIWAAGVLGRIEGLKLGRLECRLFLAMAKENMQRAINNFQTVTGLEVPNLKKQENKDEQV